MEDLRLPAYQQSQHLVQGWYASQSAEDKCNLVYSQPDKKKYFIINIFKIKIA